MDHFESTYVHLLPECANIALLMLNKEEKQFISKLNIVQTNAHVSYYDLYKSLNRFLSIKSSSAESNFTLNDYDVCIKLVDKIQINISHFSDKMSSIDTITKSFFSRAFDLSAREQAMKYAWIYKPLFSPSLTLNQEEERVLQSLGLNFKRNVPLKKLINHFFKFGDRIDDNTSAHLMFNLKIDDYDIMINAIKRACVLIIPDFKV
jgi:hypothetical protein